MRETLEWRDTIYLAGFSQACTATRARKSSLIIPGGSLVTHRVDGRGDRAAHRDLRLGPLNPGWLAVEQAAPDALAPGGQPVPTKAHEIGGER
ncbi:MAG: hypothetical protein M3460_05735 [Actinomycetota bacterium]|nr:hypothetical protein [Actinomycetota bacterium]